MDLQVVVPTVVLERLRQHATLSYPDECCGILIGGRDRHASHGVGSDAVFVSREVRCANTVEGPDRRRRFAIDPRALLDVIKGLRESDEEIVGFYHSHPDTDAKLSSTDLTFVSLWPETVWIVLSVGKDGPRHERAWWLPFAPAVEGESATPSPLELPLFADSTGALAS
jgi:proteasome lid subunit RPN8/RPN11